MLTHYHFLVQSELWLYEGKILIDDETMRSHVSDVVCVRSHPFLLCLFVSVVKFVNVLGYPHLTIAVDNMDWHTT